MSIVEQPGPVQQPRQLVAVSETSQDYILILEGEGDFLTRLEEALIANDIDFAGIKILGGCFGDMEYYTGIPDPAGIRIATYGPPTPVTGPLTCLSGNASLGRDSQDRPVIHCHGVVADQAGLVIGGHINKGGCALGPGGVRLLITSHPGAGFKIGHDAETTFDVFHPMVIGAKT